MLRRVRGVAGEQGTGGDEQAVTIEAVPNRLVLWRSDLVTNARTECSPKASATAASSTASLYAIQFWMHGVYLDSDSTMDSTASAALK